MVPTTRSIPLQERIQTWLRHYKTRYGGIAEAFARAVAGDRIPTTFAVTRPGEYTVNGWSVTTYLDGSQNIEGDIGFHTNVIYRYATAEVSQVPIPAAAFMFAPALLGFLGLRRRSKQA